MEAKRLEKIWRKDGEIKDDGGKIEAKNRGEKMVKQRMMMVKIEAKR